MATTGHSMHQTSLPGLCPLAMDVERMSIAGSDERGAIFTRREVVDFMLDLIGYTTDQPLHTYQILEPSFGEGDFLIPVVERLVRATRESGQQVNFRTLKDSIRGVELHTETYKQIRSRLVDLLVASGAAILDAEKLVSIWILQGDFLLCDLELNFTHVIGNPPYIRQENIPDSLIEEYRRRFSTIYDRADLYVPFIEKSLTHLAPSGQLGFICADRWMKNRYGQKLRSFIYGTYHLKTYVDMVDTDAFHSEVSAYPAIIVLQRGEGEVTRIARKPVLESAHLKRLAVSLNTAKRGNIETPVIEARGVASGKQPWLLDHFDELDLVRRLEDQFPLIEEVGCKIGIGVATGADKIFIGDFEQLDVEEDRKLPIVMTRDIRSGSISWQGKGVINPFADDGSLVDLSRYPKLSRYLNDNSDVISRRHVARKNPNRWYRTIDRIYPELVRKPKLLIPDIKGDAHIVLDNGRYYPHHNLYYITSDEWPIELLQLVMHSGIARLFVSLYSTKMRGGYLRFQAQYLRRIRLPAWNSVPNDIRRSLALVASSGDQEDLIQIISNLYGLTDAEKLLVQYKINK